MKNKCPNCQKLEWSRKFGTYWQQRYESEYLDGRPRWFLNQNGELIQKSEGGAYDAELV